MRGHYADIWRAIAQADPERVAIRTADGQTWTYARFAQEAGALAATLADAGLRSGDRVAMLLYNRPEFLVAFFACVGSGLTPVPLNFRFRAAEVADLLNDSGARALLAPTSLSVVAREAAALTVHPPVLVAIEDDATPFPDALRWADAVAGDTPLPSATDGTEMWMYTGGTTGRPKAVRWDAQDMFEVQMFAAYSLSDLTWPTSHAEAVAIALDPATPRTVNLPLAPFMHGTALTTSTNTLSIGGTVLVTSSPRLDADAAVRFAAEAGATRIIVAGDAVAIPLADAAEASGIGLPTVGSIMSSGMRFSPETKARLHALGDLAIFDLLASTEGGGFAVTTTRGATDLPGRPQLFPTAVVLDEQRREVQDRPGALGILAQQGALPLGYHGDPEKTAETFPVLGGVRHVIPGDWVRVEDDRHIEFLGRGSGVINTGGEKVYPLEIEEALLSHPAVADVVVLGLPDPRFGEVVAAVVERAGDVSADSLLAHVDRLLAGYKKPRHIAFRPSLDRTPTGKVDIGRMRDDVLSERDGGASR